MIPDKSHTGAAGVIGSTVSSQGTGAGSRPSVALQRTSNFKPKEIEMKVVDPKVARTLCETRHYLSRDSPDQTNFPGYSSFWDTVKYNPAFQGHQMRPDSLKFPVFI